MKRKLIMGTWIRAIALIGAMAGLSAEARLVATYAIDPNRPLGACLSESRLGPVYYAMSRGGLSTRGYFLSFHCQDRINRTRTAETLMRSISQRQHFYSDDLSLAAYRSQLWGATPDAPEGSIRAQVDAGELTSFVPGLRTSCYASVVKAEGGRPLHLANFYCALLVNASSGVTKLVSFERLEPVGRRVIGPALERCAREGFNRVETRYGDPRAYLVCEGASANALLRALEPHAVSAPWIPMERGPAVKRSLGSGHLLVGFGERMNAVDSARHVVADRSRCERRGDSTRCDLEIALGYDHLRAYSRRR